MHAHKFIHNEKTMVTIFGDYKDHCGVTPAKMDTSTTSPLTVTSNVDLSFSD